MRVVDVSAAPEARYGMYMTRFRLGVVLFINFLAIALTIALVLANGVQQSLAPTASPTPTPTNAPSTRSPTS